MAKDSVLHKLQILCISIEFQCFSTFVFEFMFYQSSFLAAIVPINVCLIELAHYVRIVVLWEAFIFSSVLTDLFILADQNAVCLCGC